MSVLPPGVLLPPSRLRRSSAEALRRFSSGDLQSECDEGEVDPYTGQPATTSQPKPQNQRPVSQGKGTSLSSFSPRFSYENIPTYKKKTSKDTPPSDWNKGIIYCKNYAE